MIFSKVKQSAILEILKKIQSLVNLLNIYLFITNRERNIEETNNHRLGASDRWIRLIPNPYCYLLQQLRKDERQS